MPLTRIPTPHHALFLSDGTVAEWLAFIRGCLNYDFYHLPFYHRLATMGGDCRAVLIRYEEGTSRIGMPFLLRPIAELGEGAPYASTGYDANSVYGYPGPVSSQSEFDPAFLHRFHDHLVATLRELGVISAFSRLHPIMGNAGLLAGVGEIHHAGETISIDTTLNESEQLAQYRRGVRSTIGRLERLGVECRETAAPDAIDTFGDMYAKAMQRLNAPQHLRFNERWIRLFLGNGEAHARLFICSRGTTDLCGAVATLCNGVVEIHLAATYADHMALSPSKLLFDRIRQWGVAHGARVVHLGGGVGASRDSLHQFKAGFSKRCHSFSTWRLVVDQERYRVLTTWRSCARDDDGGGSSIDFFPEYRNPLLPKTGQVSADVHQPNAALPPNPNACKTKVDIPVTSVNSRHRIIILGAGGHAKVVADALAARSQTTNRLEVIGCLDDKEDSTDRRVLGFPVLGTLNELTTIPHEGVVIAIGDNAVRKRLYDELVAHHEKLITVVHPRATIAHDVHIGPGSVVFAGVVINSGARIGKNVILNTGCTVDHDCLIESHAHICPGAHLGGTVTVGEGAFLGIGSTVIHSQAVGAWTTVGAGAVVINRIDDHMTVVGSPARPIQRKPTRSGVVVDPSIDPPLTHDRESCGDGYVSPLRLHRSQRSPHRVAIYGAGGLGREIALAVSDSRSHERGDVVCYIDDHPKIQGSRIDGIPVLSLDQCRTSFPEAQILCAMGSPSDRSTVVARVNVSGGSFASFIHPTVSLGKSVKVGRGCLITEGCVLTCDIALGEFVILNLHTTIGHDVSVGPFTLIGPGVRIGGAVRIGEGVHIGMGAMIVNATPERPITIGDGASIGAGSCVLSSVPAGRAVFGSPARPSPGAVSR